MKQLPIPKSIYSIINKTFKLASSKPQKITDHISATLNLTIEEVPKKMDYASDIKILIRKFHMSIDDVAKLLNMSKSYVYKLLKK